MPNPDPGGNYDNYLTGVDARASNDVWAVGFYRAYSPLSLVTHWNGSAWSDPNLTGVSGSVLYGVKDLAADNVWAVGYNGFDNHALILRYNGASWTEVPSAAPDANVHMYGIDAAAPDDIWAVGSQVEHWVGGSWSVVTAPNAGTLHGVKAISANDVWAVGTDAFLHWDGAAWSLVASPASGSLSGIDALFTNDVWAVGTQNMGGVSRTLIEHYTSGCITPSPTSTQTPTPTVTSTQPTSTDTSTNTTTGTSTNTPTGTQTPQATVTTTPTSCTIEFSDVPEGSTFYPYVRCLACRGIVQGYPDGTYHPNADLTRGQAAKIIANSAGWNDAIPPTQQTFTDVLPGSTFWVYIERAYLHGAIGGYPCGGTGEPCNGNNDPYYRPGNTVTRGQIAKVASIAAGYNDAIPPTQQTFIDVPPGSTFWVYIERVALHGVVNGYADGTYRPENPVTRGQIAKIAALAFFPACASPGR